jgi:hypothetical protein
MSITALISRLTINLKCLNIVAPFIVIIIRIKEKQLMRPDQYYRSARDSTP